MPTTGDIEHLLKGRPELRIDQTDWLELLQLRMKYVSSLARAYSFPTLASVNAFPDRPKDMDGRELSMPLSDIGVYFNAAVQKILGKHGLYRWMRCFVVKCKERCVDDHLSISGTLLGLTEDNAWIVLDMSTFVRYGPESRDQYELYPVESCQDIPDICKYFKCSPCNLWVLIGEMMDDFLKAENVRLWDLKERTGRLKSDTKIITFLDETGVVAGWSACGPTEIRKDERFLMLDEQPDEGEDDTGASDPAKT